MRPPRAHGHDTAGDATARPGSAASPDRARTRAPVILLAENDPAAEIRTVRVLRRARIANEVIVLRDGVAVLDYLLGVARGETPVPVCVLLDLTLARVDGLEILDRLRMDDRTTRLPVLMLASDTDHGHRLNAAQLGTCRAVRKPLEITEFITAAREIGLSWMVVADPAAARAPAFDDQDGMGTPSVGTPTRLTTGDRCPA